MPRYRIGLILIITIASMSGCQKKKDTSGGYVSQSLQEVVTPKTQNTPMQAPQMHPAPPAARIHPIHAPNTPSIGIVVDQNHIIIDTKQTKRFLESLTHKIDHNFKQIAQGLRKEKLRFPNETGIVITPDRIEVDLNKTQNFVHRWMHSMEAVGQQLDGIAKELDNTLKP